MSYVRNDFTVTQKILETKWISLRKEVGQKIRQIYQAHFKSTRPCVTKEDIAVSKSLLKLDNESMTPGNIFAQI